MPAPVPGDSPREGLLLALVTAGGALGGLLRWTLGEVVPGAGDPVDLVLFTINVVGAFALGLLPGLLAARARGLTPRARAGLAAFAGPGLLGGFTTLSAVSLATRALLDDGRWGTALLELGATLVCAVAAVALARRLTGPDGAP